MENLEGLPQQPCRDGPRGGRIAERERREERGVSGEGERGVSGEESRAEPTKKKKRGW